MWLLMRRRVQEVIVDSVRLQPYGLTPDLWHHMQAENARACVDLFRSVDKDWEGMSDHVLVPDAREKLRLGALR